MGAVTIAIDPGKATGFALFSGSALASAGTFDPTSVQPPPSILVQSARGASVVYEYPCDRGANRVNPDDLIRLASRLGIVLGILRSYGCIWPATEVRPHDWKGQAPKSVCHGRIARGLTPNEMSIWASLRASEHDAKDAIGIGLWFHNRFGLR